MISNMYWVCLYLTIYFRVAMMFVYFNIAQKFFYISFGLLLAHRLRRWYNSCVEQYLIYVSYWVEPLNGYHTCSLGAFLILLLQRNDCDYLIFMW